MKKCPEELIHSCSSVRHSEVSTCKWLRLSPLSSRFDPSGSRLKFNEVANFLRLKTREKD